MIILTIVVVGLIAGLRWVPYNDQNAVRLYMLSRGQVIGSILCQPKLEKQALPGYTKQPGQHHYDLGGWWSYDAPGLGETVTDIRVNHKHGRIVSVKPDINYGP